MESMMRTVLFSGLAAALFLATPSSADDLMKKAQENFKPIPSMVPAVKDNPITHEKIELGKLLFFDPRLSASEVISCNTCHNLGTGGVDAGPTSVGHAWQRGPRRAPTVYNAVFNIAQFWDGRAADLKAQAKGPVQASVEMNATPDHVVRTLLSMGAYVDMFQKAFPGDSSPVTFDNFAKAIEAFEATLITPAAKFDQYLEGDATALNEREKSGLTLFMGKGCVACHNGINVGGLAYFPFGVVENPGAEVLPPSDKGRFNVSKTASDEYVFRAAPLRNFAGALLSLRAGLEPQTGGRRDGRRAIGRQADRPGGGRHRGLPQYAHRRNARRAISDAADPHRRNAGAVARQVTAAPFVTLSPPNLASETAAKRISPARRVAQC
jgi:cytochrome c peroxidase